MKTLIFMLVIPVLSGCSMGVYGDHFECSPDKGMGCLSVSEVNRAVSKDPQLKETKKCLSCTSDIAQTTFSQKRVYFPSYQDAKGHWHQGRYVYIKDEALQ